MATKDRIYSAGDVIGGIYRVNRVMEGGLGVVYAVEDNDENRLILKSPKSQLDEDVLKGFRIEAETWIRLGHHANIVPAFWVNEVAGLLFVAAELVEVDEAGCVSLRDVLRFGFLRPQTVAAWAAHFCFGMEHAHSRGLVAHRDIKPENLLIGASKQLKITDFGLANAFARRLTDEIDRDKVGDWNTLGGPLAGTPQYMAPEQWLGGRQDFRTDVYAFGVVLFEMCFGVNPFDAIDFNKIASNHLSKRPEVPAAMFSSLIERCLQKKPEARFSTPQELFEALSAICKANALALPQRPKETDKQVDELFALSSVLQMKQKYSEAKKIVQRLIDLEPDRARNWTELGVLHLRVNNPEEAKAALEKSLLLDGTRSAAWNNLGLTFKKMGEWKAAIAAFDKAIDCDPTNTGALANGTEPLLNDKRGGEAIIRLRRAVTLAPDKFQTWNALGAAYIHLGIKKEALAALEKAMSLAPREYLQMINNNLKIAMTLSETKSALALWDTGEIEEAEKNFIEEIKADPKHISSWHNLGMLYIKKEKWRDAIDCFSHVHELDPIDGFAVCRIIELGALLKDVASVEKWCSVLASMPNGQIASIAFKARALAQCDRYQEAKRMILDAVRQYPNEPDILIACGDVMMWYPNVSIFMENACDAYERAVELLKTQWDMIDRQREIEGRLEIALRYRKKCQAGYLNSEI